MDGAWTENRVTSARLTARGLIGILWDYCSYSAASLFGTCVADSIADRIHEALQASPGGLTREQIRNLFHGQVSSGSIDQALERLSSLELATSRYVTGRGPGRRTILWSAIDHDQQELMEEETAESDDFSRISLLSSHILAISRTRDFLPRSAGPGRVCAFP